MYIKDPPSSKKIFNVNWTNPKSKIYKAWAASGSDDQHVYDKWCQREYHVDSMYGTEGHCQKNEEHVRMQKEWDTVHKNTSLQLNGENRGLSDDEKDSCELSSMKEESSNLLSINEEKPELKENDVSLRVKQEKISIKKEKDVPPRVKKEKIYELDFGSLLIRLNLPFSDSEPLHDFLKKICQRSNCCAKLNNQQTQNISHCSQ